MAGPFTPSDDLIGPIVAALGNAMTTQITTPPIVYATPPDGQPEDNSVMIGLEKWEVDETLSGKMDIKLTFNVWHFIMRSDAAQNITDCYSWFHTYLSVFSAWGNQSLGGTAREVTPIRGGVAKQQYAGTPYFVLAMKVAVCTEYNVDTSGE